MNIYICDHNDVDLTKQRIDCIFCFGMEKFVLPIRSEFSTDVYYLRSSEIPMHSLLQIMTIIKYLIINGQRQ